MILNLFSCQGAKGKTIKETFYRNGRLKTRTEILNGKQNGSYVEFYLNGNIKTEGKYLNDSLVGVWKFYRENSTLQEEIGYVLTNKGNITNYNVFFDLEGLIIPDSGFYSIITFNKDKYLLTDTVVAKFEMPSLYFNDMVMIILGELDSVNNWKNIQSTDTLYDGKKGEIVVTEKDRIKL